MVVGCGSARDRLGRTLGGRYHLREVLGAGGTAVVYRAHASDGRPVAVKVLHDHLSRSEEVCRRFVREGQLGNVLDHPGVVRVLDHGWTEEGSPYLVLELLEGESLEERRDRVGGRLDLDETLDYIDQLLAVLEVAHAKNIVHRDIKPSNLFVTRAGRLKVLDFGIARLTDDTSSATSTKTGQTVGTPAFMPPEQALSRPREVDARTDIWSVGATMFTLLSGEHVHVAESSSEHLVKAATLHARSLARALPGVPANVEALVARSLAFDKEDRWSSAAAMRAELARVRLDPGRRIGTSTSPPPDRSSANLPTLVGATRAGPVEKPSDSSSAAVMALASRPGAERTFAKRNGLLSLGVAATAVLVAAGALGLASRMGEAPRSTLANPTKSELRTERVRSLVVETPPSASVRAPRAGAPGARPKPTSGGARSDGGGAASLARAGSSASASSKSTPRKDIYRPF